jgi:hypothetical protein
MNRIITRYIDNLIREHATNTRDGLSLDVQEIDNNDQENLVDFLFANDPATREMLQDRIQELLESRLPFVESYDNYDNGFIPKHDNQTGEVCWVARGAL